MKTSPKTDHPVRCAIYDRVSTEMQAEYGRSLETQHSDLMRYAAVHGYEIAGCYTDEGITARKKMKNRKDFLRLLRDVEADKIDLILVTKLDRWFRNIRDYYATQEILDAHHCSWKTIYEDYDSSTADGQLKINIMLSVAQNECDRTSERIKAVFRYKTQAGEITTASQIHFGYRAMERRLVIDEQYSPIVKEAYQIFFATHSKQAAYRHCLQKFGDVFSYQTFKHFFTCEIYAGKYRTNEHFCPPYLTPSQWEEIQQINARNIKLYAAKDGPNVYLFTGILKCPACGSTLSGTSTTAKSGVRFHYYRCWKHRADHSCGFRSAFSERKLEHELMQKILAPCSRPFPSLSLRPKGNRQEKGRKTEAAFSCESQLKRLNDLYIRGRISRSDYDAKYACICERLKPVCAPCTDAPAQDPGHTRLLTALSAGFQDVYERLDSTHKRSFWHNVMESVEFSTDRVICRFTLLP